MGEYVLDEISGKIDFGGYNFSKLVLLKVKIILQTVTLSGKNLA